jgi:hypothetical protein
MKVNRNVTLGNWNVMTTQTPDTIFDSFSKVLASEGGASYIDLFAIQRINSGAKFSRNVGGSTRSCSLSMYKYEPPVTWKRSWPHGLHSVSLNVSIFLLVSR